MPAAQTCAQSDHDVQEAGLALLAAAVNGDEGMSRHVLHHVAALEALIALAEADRVEGQDSGRVRHMRGSPASLRRSRGGPESPGARSVGRAPASQAKARRPQASQLPPISISAAPSIREMDSRISALPSMASVGSGGGRSAGSAPSASIREIDMRISTSSLPDAMPLSSKSVAVDILEMLGPFNWIECENCHNRDMCGRYCQRCGHRTPGSAM